LKIPEKAPGGSLLTNRILNEKGLREIPIITMAYIGDAVFELMVRTYMTAAGKRKIKDIHRDTVELVKAKSQAILVKEIFNELSEEERNIVKRGRNTKSTPSKNADIGDYRMSTGFEALLGYLYLKGEDERLLYLFEKALAIVH
jgi:ribonuclease-3 family protein